MRSQQQRLWVVAVLCALQVGCGGGSGTAATAEPETTVSSSEQNSDDTGLVSGDRPVFQITSVSEMGGVLLPSSAESSGDPKQFQVHPSSGYRLSSIEGCGGTLVGDQYTTSSITAACQIRAEFISNAEVALANEDHTEASAEELIDYSHQQLGALKTTQQALISTLYQDVGESISWHPTHDSVTLATYMPESSYPVLLSTQKSSGESSSEGLIYAGEQAGHRYAAMGANLFVVDRSAQTDTLLKNLLSWLTQGGSDSGTFRVVTSHLPSRADSWYFPHNEKVRLWLDEFLPGAYAINDENSCDYDALLGCLADQPSLLILSSLDRDGLGAESIRQALEFARTHQIPVLFSNYRRDSTELSAPVYRYMGLIASNNYWSEHQAVAKPVAELEAISPALQAVEALLHKLDSGEFDYADLAECDRNFINCTESTFANAFKTGADWYRDAAIAVDEQQIRVFDVTQSFGLLKAGLLLADKYREQIDYPITSDETASWQQALFADWVVSYFRLNNLPQPDLGEYVWEKSLVLKEQAAHYAYPDTVEDLQTLSVPYSNQWTTTGWYALPGQRVTLSRMDSSETAVQIKLNYHRANTNRAYQQGIYLAPLERMTQRMTLAAGENVSFSSPYGGPIYLYLSGAETPLSVSVTATGVVHHPTITDFGDDAQIYQFQQLIENTELPHVDLRTDGAEQHLRRDKFLNALDDSLPTVESLLTSIEQDHINAAYTLAGLKIQGASLRKSLPQDVVSNCEALFGEECFDESLHVRTIIQHANYDQNAHCGSGCSGNPWDASWDISPTGWGDNHELGHNLQTRWLNVNYVTEANRDDWNSYSNRATENSNNIFPYFVKWRAHYLRDGLSDTLTDHHMNYQDLFFVFQSDALNTTDSEGSRVVYDRNCTALSGDRFSGPWLSNSYAANNGYRMAFYLQLPLRLHGQSLSGGAVLQNGFNIFTLLYQHSRLFKYYASDATLWDSNRERLGFGLLPFSGEVTYGGGRVSDMPGNDFLLISLSKFTGQDWRPYFDMFGLRYSVLAESQMLAHVTQGAVPVGLYLLEDELPPADMSESLTFLSLSFDDPELRWPLDNRSPADCL